ncbi:uncharacterized protein SCHCODRAFT_02496117 [Schizophyllum commune H4-8]|nr:uncharacterized protein SCHCODRAFT_02496117 [Schizophyllum commune H4-8]KAI5895093.1 hypothetical protein SCHCODRAFT_02496117 [Schizophyllum commune H4-8]
MVTAWFACFVPEVLRRRFDSHQRPIELSTQVATHSALFRGLNRPPSIVWRGCFPHRRRRVHLQFSSTFFTAPLRGAREKGGNKGVSEKDRRVRTKKGVAKARVGEFIERSRPGLPPPMSCCVAQEGLRKCWARTAKSADEQMLPAKARDYSQRTQIGGLPVNGC